MSIYVICGGDRRGKTTAAKRIAKILGKPYFKFPYGSDNDTVEEIYSGKIIREILNDKEHPCHPVAFQALQLINKLEAIEVLKRLEAEYGIVIVDRWTLSALIYGTVDGVDRKWNEKIARMFDKEIQPTIMFVLTGEPFGKDDDIYSEKQVTIAKLYEEYCALHMNNPSVVNIDVTGMKDKEAELALEVLGYIVRDIMPKRNPCKTTTTSTTTVRAKPFNPAITDVKDMRGLSGTRSPYPFATPYDYENLPEAPQSTLTDISTNEAEFDPSQAVAHVAKSGW